MKYLAHWVWVIWFIVRRWVWDTDMPGALVADEMCLGRTFTSMAAAMICKLLTGKVVMGLTLLILRGITLWEWVNLAQNNFPRIIGDEHKWYPLWRQNSVPCCISAIQSAPLQGHPALTSGFEPIMVVTMPGGAETFNRVINKDDIWNRL